MDQEPSGGDRQPEPTGNGHVPDGREQFAAIAGQLARTGEQAARTGEQLARSATGQFVRAGEQIARSAGEQLAKARVPLPLAMQRQLGAAMRSAFRPATYVGFMREVVLSSVHAWTYPFGFVPQPPRPNGTIDPTARRPVLLIHGWVHNRSAFLMMGRNLRKAGLGPVHTFTYPSLTADLDQVARDLDPVVRKLVGDDSENSCILIGHSMGGLIARQYVQEFGGDRLVDTVVTMGTPHRGTYSAYWGAGLAAQQCRPGSAYLQQLDRTARATTTEWISYYSDLDFMITPAISAKLTHPALRATNVRVHDTGHLSLLMSRWLIDDLLHRLELSQRRVPHNGRPRPDQDTQALA